MRFIGDVHGKFERYKKIIKTCDESIQVGDMGVGFLRNPLHDPFGTLNQKYLTNPPHYAMTEDGKNHRFIRGNHDNPYVCKKHSQYIQDGTIENDVMFIGGALSIDKQYRTIGVDWWEDEELSVPELNQMIDTYLVAKPRVMICHECPESIADILLHRKEKLDYPSRTRQAFQAMFEEHQPELWIFGHWHLSFDKVINGCRFICLNELEYADVDMKTLEMVKQKGN